MICLRCGYCCTHYDVLIMVNPYLPPERSNMTLKPCGERCKYLIGNKVGEYSCSIHNTKYYRETQCYDYSQTEIKNTICKIGQVCLDKEKVIGIYCVDCKWYKRQLLSPKTYGLCTCTSFKRNKDEVTGKTDLWFASTCRLSSFRCGTNAKYFVKKVSIIKRILNYYKRRLINESCKL